MMKVLVILVVIILSGCTSLKSVDAIDIMDSQLDDISYFLNRLECFDKYDMCQTNGFEMYISKNNDTLFAKNSRETLTVFIDKGTYTVYQLNINYDTLFFTSNPTTQSDRFDNACIANLINDMAESLY